MASDLLHDMLLLENQLPIHFLIELYEFVVLKPNMSFLELSRKYFVGVGKTSTLQVTDDCYRARHLLEFLLYLHQPDRPTVEPAQRNGKFEYTRSASELHQAGVKFVLGTEESLFQVHFSVAKGLLTIPKVTVNDFTETFFRNLIAFEQCCHYHKHTTSYIVFMDCLIDTPNDVELLIKHGIMENMLGENQLVADLFNNLYKEVAAEQREFYFAIKFVMISTIIAKTGCTAGRHPGSSGG